MHVHVHVHVQAPELKLGEENFMRINMDLATNDDWGRRRGPPKQLKDPPPEKYSIEWYLERAKETERSKAAPDTKRARQACARGSAVLAVWPAWWQAGPISAVALLP